TYSLFRVRPPAAANRGRRKRAECGCDQRSSASSWRTRMSALTPSAVAARPPAWPRAWTRFMVIGILGALILGGALVAGSLPRLREQAAVQKSTEAGIHSRTTGYIVKRPVDIGDRVAEGDLLAEIATPEIDAQLE